MSTTVPTVAVEPIPVRKSPAQLIREAARNWRARHRVPFNFAIHLIGIPLAVVGLLLCVLDWRWGLGSIAVGYFLQWLGHYVEGNDVGEWAAVKRLLGLPYVSIAPRWTTVPVGSKTTES